MEASRGVRILWAGPEAVAGAGGPGGGEFTRVLSAQDAVQAAVAAAARGAWFAVAFLSWGEDQFDADQLCQLLAPDPDLFLVLEGAAADLPTAHNLPPCVRPDRCLTLVAPVDATVRSSLAHYLGLRWQRESEARRHIARLESEARETRASQLRQEERLQVLYGIVEKVHDAERVEHALQVGLQEMTCFLGARTGSLLLLDGLHGLRVVEAVGPNCERIVGLRIPLAESRISRYALLEREPILVEDMQCDERFRESRDGIRYRARSILSVPLLARGGPLGVINFGGDARQGSFTEWDRDLVVTLGRQLTVAVEKLRLMEGLRQSVDEAIQALAGAIEAKDPCTRGHSDRVRHYSGLVARRLQLADEEVDRVMRAATLHDVGKIGVPELVLNKKGLLDRGERRLIERHPDVGVEIVREIGGMEGTLEIIHAHHERYDGAGYPRGLCAEELPMGARILGVVDSFDAMTSDRPYRRGLPVEAACREIRACSGTQFDPEVAQVFLDGVESWPDLVPPTVPAD